MNIFEATSFYGDTSWLREFSQELLSENGFAMWVQLELFS